MTDRILLIKGISGLGDRILCLLTGALYARLSGRALVVDWSDDGYASGGFNAFHSFFLSPFCGPSNAVPESDSVVPPLWKGRLQESAASLRAEFDALTDANGWRIFSIDPGRLDYPERVAVLWTYGAELDSLLPYLDPGHAEFGPAERTQLLSHVLHDTLMLQPAIRRRVDAILSERFAGRMVGVHVRYTDHRTALAATLRAVDAIIAEDPACGIFLATDNARIERLFSRRYDRVVAAPHTYPRTPGTPLHHGAARPDPALTGIEAVVDLYLLAECDDLIIDSSSNFGYVASLLSRAAPSRVIDVKSGGKLHPRIRHAANRIMRKLRVNSWGPELVGRLVR